MDKIMSQLYPFLSLSHQYICNSRDVPANTRLSAVNAPYTDLNI